MNIHIFSNLDTVCILQRGILSDNIITDKVSFAHSWGKKKFLHAIASTWPKSREQVIAIERDMTIIKILYVSIRREY